MNKQRFVALYLLVTISTTYGMGFSDKKWNNLFKDGESFNENKQWQQIAESDQKTKDEALKRAIFTDHNRSQNTRYALEAGANPNLEVNGAHLLLPVILSLDYDLVEALLKHGADIPDYVWQYITVLSIASLLANHSPKSYKKENYCLHYAAHQRYPVAIMQFHLQHEASPNAPDGKGNTPLHKLVEHTCSYSQQTQGEIFEKATLLLDAGACSNICNKDKKTAPDLAQDYINQKLPREKFKIYELLIDKMQKRTTIISKEKSESHKIENEPRKERLAKPKEQKETGFKGAIKKLWKDFIAEDIELEYTEG